MGRWLVKAALLTTWALYTAGFWMTFVHVLFNHLAANTVWEWAMAALGSAFLPKRLRNSSRRAALRCSKVPSMRHFLNRS